MNHYDIFMACMGAVLVIFIVVMGMIWKADDD